MTETNENNFFADEGRQKSNKKNHYIFSARKILVVDDEKDIHTITKMTLGDFLFNGKDIEILSAFSAMEAKSILEKQPDISLVLLDVVMESETAGLELVKYIRKDLNNKNIRIILRTGQPGVAPERKVMEDYDIDDYREKTELTADRLYSVVQAGLRTFSYMKQLENKLSESEKKLNTIINATTELAFLVDCNGNFLMCNDAFAKSMGRKKEEIIGMNMLELFSDIVSKEKVAKIQEIIKSKKHLRWKDKRERRYFDNSAYPILDDNGSVIQIVAYITDITQRKQTEEELQKHREHLEELVKERTLELEEKNAELEHYNQLFVGREFRIKELRDRVKELEDKISDI